MNSKEAAKVLGPLEIRTYIAPATQDSKWGKVPEDCVEELMLNWRRELGEEEFTAKVLELMSGRTVASPMVLPWSYRKVKTDGALVE